jgi:Flp pilus assembly protein TadB
VALSDDEQRVLAEIEHDLVTDDRRFAESIGRRRMDIPTPVWAVGICLGLGCIVFGLITAGGIGTAVAVVGFVVIVASCWAALRSYRRRRPRPAAPQGGVTST